MDTDDCLMALQAAVSMAKRFEEDTLILQNLKVVRASEWDGHYLERIRYDESIRGNNVFK
jgi:hypothetical protein